MVCKLACMEFFFWAAFSIIAYMTVYLENIGYSVKQAALLSSTISMVAMISLPIMGVVADKLQSTGRSLNICIIISSLLYFLVPLTKTVFIEIISTMLIVILISRFL